MLICGIVWLIPSKSCLCCICVAAVYPRKLGVADLLSGQVLVPFGRQADQQIPPRYMGFCAIRTGANTYKLSSVPPVHPAIVGIRHIEEPRSWGYHSTAELVRCNTTAQQWQRLLGTLTTLQFFCHLQIVIGILACQT